jgi:membrane protein
MTPMPFRKVTTRRRRPSLWAALATVSLLVAEFVYRRDPAFCDREASIGPDGEHVTDGRGRNAATPSDIPARGWKDILLRVYANISRHRVLAIAAGVTFYSILAVFPAISTLVSLYGLFADPGAVAIHLDRTSSVLPGGAIDIVRDQMTRVASQGHGALGLTFLLSLVAALWSANAGVKALFDALNVVYDEEEKRGIIKLNAISLLVTTGMILVAVLAMAGVVALPAILGFMGFGTGKQALAQLAASAALFIVVAFGMGVIYRYGPSRDEPRWRWISWGSVFASVVWLAASMLFSWYAANFGSFNKTYGSLGAIVGFMTWIWLSAIVVLIGAEINAEMEHQTARDTTEGRPRPMGARGARMADTVGAPRG